MLVKPRSDSMMILTHESGSAGAGEFGAMGSMLRNATATMMSPACLPLCMHDAAMWTTLSQLLAQSPSTFVVVGVLLDTSGRGSCGAARTRKCMRESSLALEFAAELPDDVTNVSCTT
jgi:hypothetical protein